MKTKGAATFACPKCGAGTQVIDTRRVGTPNHVGIPYIRRRRKCKRDSCLFRHTTMELRAAPGSTTRGKVNKTTAFRMMSMLQKEVRRDLANRIRAFTAELCGDLESGSLQ